MQQTVRAVILAVAIAAVLATGILAFIYMRYAEDVPQPDTSRTTDAPYTLGIWEGQLAVFNGKDAYPAKLYDVAVEALPDTEQQKLRAGIAVASEGELEALLEDYTS